MFVMFACPRIRPPHELTHCQTQIIAVVKNFLTADIIPEEVSLINFMRKIAKHAIDMSEAELNAKRAYDLMDEEIQDVV